MVPLLEHPHNESLAGLAGSLTREGEKFSIFRHQTCQLGCLTNESGSDGNPGGTFIFRGSVSPAPSFNYGKLKGGWHGDEVAT